VSVEVSLNSFLHPIIRFTLSYLAVFRTISERPLLAVWTSSKNYR